MPYWGERRTRPLKPSRSRGAPLWVYRAGPLQTLTTLTLLCAAGYLAWRVGWSRHGTLVPFHIAVIDAAVLILSLTLLVIIGLMCRRPERVDHRFAVEMRGRIDDEIVALLDLSWTGLAFGSSHEWPVGARARLLTRLGAGSGALRDAELELLVTSCGYDESNTRFRVGAELVNIDDATRQLIVEYCYVYQPLDRAGHHTDVAASVLVDPGGLATC